ncbi:hypothetical protein L1049_026980 [Liquidambar formosana]|uniref:Uncharacterized protein n=1 Tax=Liquidambar formosana TaxID=63359 RepID=A0AAP0NEC3_LIQFO
MRSEFSRQFRHQKLHERSSFLPMLCSKPSIKDVSLPQWKDRSASFSDDPLSPRVGCMGQVKRNNRVVGYPSTTTLHRFPTTPTKSQDRSIKYFKLKKLFSGKNLLTPPSTAATNSSCSSRGRQKSDYDSSENSVSISVVDLDPPLPVPKRPVQQRNDGDSDGINLWKRRSGGLALKSLQVQQIHLSNQFLQPTSA